MDIYDDRSTTLETSHPQFYGPKSQTKDNIMLDRKISQIETMLQVQSNVIMRMLEDFNTRMLEEMRQVRKIAFGDQEAPSTPHTAKWPSFSASDQSMFHRQSDGGGGPTLADSMQRRPGESAAITPPSDTANISEENAPAQRRRTMAKRGNHNGLGATPRGRDAAPLPSTQEDELLIASERRANRALATRPSKTNILASGATSGSAGPSESNAPPRVAGSALPSKSAAAAPNGKNTTPMAPPPIPDSRPASRGTGDRNRHDDDDDDELFAMSTDDPNDSIEVVDASDSESDGSESKPTRPTIPGPGPLAWPIRPVVDNDRDSDMDYEPPTHAPPSPVGPSTQSVAASVEHLMTPVPADTADSLSQATLTDPTVPAPVAPMMTSSGTLASGAASPKKRGGGGRAGAGRKPGAKSRTSVGTGAAADAPFPITPAMPAAAAGITVTPGRRGGARAGAGRPRGGGGSFGGSSSSSARKADRLLAETPEWEREGFDRDEYVARREREAAANQGSSTRGPRSGLFLTSGAQGGGAGGESPGEGSAAKKRRVGEQAGPGSAKRRFG